MNGRDPQLEPSDTVPRMNIIRDPGPVAWKPVQGSHANDRDPQFEPSDAVPKMNIIREPGSEAELRLESGIVTWDVGTSKCILTMC